MMKAGLKARTARMNTQTIPGLLPGGETPLERATRVLTEQPFSVLVGAKVGTVERGRAELRKWDIYTDKEKNDGAYDN